MTIRLKTENKTHRGYPYLPKEKHIKDPVWAGGWWGNKIRGVEQRGLRNKGDRRCWVTANIRWEVSGCNREKGTYMNGDG